MNWRTEYARLQRLRTVARAHPVAPAHVAALIQPFIDKYKNLRLQRRSTPSAAPSGNSLPLRHPRHDTLVAAVVELGVALRRAGVRGLAYHTALQKAVAELAAAFACRGFVECFAAYDAADHPDHDGRMDVVWAAGRVPQVLFELDSTVKRISLTKLLLADAPHKYWVYFGPDVWAFKTQLKKWDPEGQVAGVVVPLKFAPVSRP